MRDNVLDFEVLTGIAAANRLLIPRTANVSTKMKEVIQKIPSHYDKKLLYEKS